LLPVWAQAARATVNTTQIQMRVFIKCLLLMK
jgi:hypothetical protein